MIQIGQPVLFIDESITFLANSSSRFCSEDVKVLFLCISARNIALRSKKKPATQKQAILNAQVNKNLIAVFIRGPLL